MAQEAGAWLNRRGPEGDVVVSSRVRLARNLAGFRFVWRAEEDELQHIRDLLKNKLLQIVAAPTYISMEEMGAVERGVLMERNLISSALSESNRPAGVLFTADESMGAMVNEEDHLRLHVTLPGLELQKGYLALSEADEKMEHEVEYAFSERFGYLTACPTNTGTGLRASVMLHLPALVMTRQMGRVFESVFNLGLAIRGFHGEGTGASGDFYQISNQKTLGKAESVIIDDLLSFVPEIIRYEREVREALLGHTRSRLEDRIWRAYGILRTSRLISTEEALDMLSLVRLGAVLKLLNGVTLEGVNQLFILTQPAHTQQRAGGSLADEERDGRRAAFLRKWFSAN